MKKPTYSKKKNKKGRATLISTVLTNIPISRILIKTLLLSSVSCIGKYNTQQH